MKLAIICLCFSIAFSKPINTKRAVQFQFPGGERKPSAKLVGTINHELTDFTLCHWSKTNKPVAGAWEAVFSYMLPEKPITILTSIQHNKLVHAYGDSKLSETTISLPSEEWVHLCFIWSVTDSTAETYVNGEMLNRHTSRYTSSSIQPNGIVQLGIYGPANAPQSQRTGQISEVNLWNYALTPDQEIYNCEDQLEGNIISWYDSVWELLDGTTISYVHLPCGGRR